MKTWLCALFALTALHSAARAHFIFVVPSEDGSTARVVFSEDLDPDEYVSIDKIAGLQLFAQTEGAKPSLLNCTKGEHFLTAKLPGSGHRLIHGSLDYGVVQKGRSAPFRLHYHPKAVVGSTVVGGATVGAPVEVVPLGEPGKVRFQVLAAGKPVPDAAMTVIVPGEGEKQVKTDADGLSPEFAQSGRFGVWARHTEPSAGEAGGERYEEVRHYATLVVEIARREP